MSHDTDPVQTQHAHPVRATVRTLFAMIVGAAAMAPLIYHAITQGDPDSATGWAAAALAIAGGITRVMALPAVDRFLARFAPWLATSPRDGIDSGKRKG